MTLGGIDYTEGSPLQPIVTGQLLRLTNVRIFVDGEKFTSTENANYLIIKVMLVCMYMILSISILQAVTYYNNTI